MGLRQDVFSPSALLSQITRFTKSRQLVVALSGGVDSYSLLHALVRIRESDPSWCIRAVHIHHNLCQEADSWAVHCQSICSDIGVHCTVYRVEVDEQEAKKTGIEAKARQMRYQALGAALKDNEIILMGHHQDDQAETLLLQCVRGAGPKGLSSMPAITIFEHSYLLRPLLTFTRAALFDYLQSEQLHWVEDISNTHIRFSRNYLRQQVIPVLTSRWPSLSKTLARVAAHCAEATRLCEEQAREQYPIVEGRWPKTLSISALQTLSRLKQINVLRYWMSTVLGITSPSTNHIEQILHTVVNSAADGSPIVEMGSMSFRRYKHHILGVAQQQIIQSLSHIELDWSLSQVLTLPADLGQLTAVAKPGLDHSVLQNMCVCVRFRRGGETIQMKSHQIHHRLKKLFQTWEVPPWLRGSIPLIYYKGQMICVVGYAETDLYDSLPFFIKAVPLNV